MAATPSSEVEKLQAQLARVNAQRQAQTEQARQRKVQELAEAEDAFTHQKAEQKDAERRIEEALAHAAAVEARLASTEKVLEAAKEALNNHHLGVDERLEQESRALEDALDQARRRELDQVKAQIVLLQQRQQLLEAMPLGGASVANPTQQHAEVAVSPAREPSGEAFREDGHDRPQEKGFEHDGQQEEEEDGHDHRQEGEDGHHRQQEQQDEAEEDVGGPFTFDEATLRTLHSDDDETEVLDANGQEATQALLNADTTAARAVAREHDVRQAHKLLIVVFSHIRPLIMAQAAHTAIGEYLPLLHALSDSQLAHWTLARMPEPTLALARSYSDLAGILTTRPDIDSRRNPFPGSYLLAERYTGRRGNPKEGAYTGVAKGSLAERAKQHDANFLKATSAAPGSLLSYTTQMKRVYRQSARGVINLTLTQVPVAAGHQGRWLRRLWAKLFNLDWPLEHSRTVTLTCCLDELVFSALMDTISTGLRGVPNAIILGIEREWGRLNTYQPVLIASTLDCELLTSAHVGRGRRGLLTPPATPSQQARPQEASSAFLASSVPEESSGSQSLGVAVDEALPLMDHSLDRLIDLARCLSDLNRGLDVTWVVSSAPSKYQEASVRIGRRRLTLVIELLVWVELGSPAAGQVSSLFLTPRNSSNRPFRPQGSSYACGQLFTRYIATFRHNGSQAQADWTGTIVPTSWQCLSVTLWEAYGHAGHLGASSASQHHALRDSCWDQLQDASAFEVSSGSVGLDSLATCLVTEQGAFFPVSRGWEITVPVDTNRWKAWSKASGGESRQMLLPQSLRVEVPGGLAGARPQDWLLAVRLPPSAALTSIEVAWHRRAPPFDAGPRLKVPRESHLRFLVHFACNLVRYRRKKALIGERKRPPAIEDGARTGGADGSDNASERNVSGSPRAQDSPTAGTSMALPSRLDASHRANLAAPVSSRSPSPSVEAQRRQGKRPATNDPDAGPVGKRMTPMVSSPLRHLVATGAQLPDEGQSVAETTSGSDVLAHLLRRRGREESPCVRRAGSGSQAISDAQGVQQQGAETAADGAVEEEETSSGAQEQEVPMEQGLDLHDDVPVSEGDQQQQHDVQLTSSDGAAGDDEQGQNPTSEGNEEDPPQDPPGVLPHMLRVLIPRNYRVDLSSSELNADLRASSDISDNSDD